MRSGTKISILEISTSNDDLREKIKILFNFQFTNIDKNIYDIN